MAEITYEIINSIAIISESSKGWTKELNLVSWNNREAKYDLREWSPTKDKMGKGLTLTTAELIRLRDVLNALDLKE